VERKTLPTIVPKGQEHPRERAIDTTGARTDLRMSDQENRSIPDASTSTTAPFALAAEVYIVSRMVPFHRRPTESVVRLCNRIMQLGVLYAPSLQLQ